MVLIPGGMVTLGVSEPLAGHERALRERRLAAFCVDVYEYPNRSGVLPRADVSWQDARQACADLGKRLCGGDEWERACRGPEGWRYSYGAERDSGACNTPWEHFEGAPVPLAASGTHPGCTSPEGVVDLNGNLSEWVEDPWDGEAPGFEQEGLAPDAVLRTVRGGTMWRKTFYGQDCLSAHGHPDHVVHMDDGFRCCADPR
jgi:eukaryotic-like serine/threonine-protein kinase